MRRCVGASSSARMPFNSGYQATDRRWSCSSGKSANYIWTGHDLSESVKEWECSSLLTDVLITTARPTPSPGLLRNPGHASDDGRTTGVYPSRAVSLQTVGHPRLDSEPRGDEPTGPVPARPALSALRRATGSEVDVTSGRLRADRRCGCRGGRWP
jgi:hypothetical protein